MKPDGHDRWHLKILINLRMRAHRYWNIGALCGGHLRVITVRVLN
jgi:hypothetical protein